MTDEQNQVPTNNDEKTLLLINIAGSFFLSFLLPLIVWIVKKDTSSPAANEIMKGTLNFQLTMFIGMVICSILSVVGIGCLLFPIVYLIDLVVVILAFLAVMDNKPYKFPITIPFVK